MSSPKLILTGRVPEHAREHVLARLRVDRGDALIVDLGLVTHLVHEVAAYGVVLERRRSCGAATRVRRSNRVGHVVAGSRRVRASATDENKEEESTFHDLGYARDFDSLSPKTLVLERFSAPRAVREPANPITHRHHVRDVALAARTLVVLSHEWRFLAFLAFSCSQCFFRPSGVARLARCRALPFSLLA